MTTVITEGDRRPNVSATPAEASPAQGADGEAPLRGEPVVHLDTAAGTVQVGLENLVHLERSPGRVDFELKDLDSLFDRDTSPSYPHTGPMLSETVAKFMLDTVREDRRSPLVEVHLTFRSSPLRPEEEAGTRAQMRSFFGNEAEMAGLERRVNRTEGLSSLRYSIPVVAVAALVVLLVTNPSTLGGPPYLTELAYLVVVVVIWVMLWDPLEKLVFDSYFIRLRIQALHKLANAKITFAYRSGPSPPAGTTAAPLV